MSATNSITHSQIFRFITWSSAILIIALGVYLSRIQFLNSEWLSRAGCLVVMLGLWSGIGVIFQERLLISRTKWQRRNAIIRAKARFIEEQIDSEHAEQALNEINKSFDNQIMETTQNLRLSIGILEVSLLMTGTFLWGFGDLLAG